MPFPQRFGDYVLEEFIAAGGMAEVFLARRADNPTGLPVCVKRVLSSFVQSRDFITMFQDEAALASRLDHENVVRVFDCGTHEGTLYMAMEYVDGVDLATVVKGLKKLGVLLSPAQVLEIGVQMCRGLHHAHTLTDDGRPLRVVHRDVSPQNVLLDMRGRVKVTDFGIAKAQGRETHTRTGVVKGKLGYMAPEQALGEELDHRTDQFATAVVLWELLAGQRLFHERSELATLEKILARPTDPPSRYRPHVPAAVDAVLLKALAKRKEERFADMAAFAQALQKCLLTLPAATTEVRLEELLRQVRAMAPRGRSAPSSPSAPAAGAATRTVPTPAGALPAAAAPGAPTEVAPALIASGRDSVAATVALRPEPHAPPAARPPAPSLLVTSASQEVPAAGGLNVLSASATPPAPSAPSFLTSGAVELPSLGEGATAASALLEDAGGVSRRVAALVAVATLVVGGVIGFLLGGREEFPCAPPSKSAQQAMKSSALLDGVELHLGSGDTGSAARDLERALKLHGSARGYTQLGKLHTQLGNIAAALEAYRCVVLLEPGSPEARSIQGKLKDAAVR